MGREKILAGMESVVKNWRKDYPMPKRPTSKKVLPKKKPKRSWTSYLKRFRPKSGTTMPSHINPKDRKWLKEELGK